MPSGQSVIYPAYNIVAHELIVTGFGFAVKTIIRQREHFLTPHRGKAELIGWGTEVGSLPARRVLTHGEVSVWGHGP